MTSKFIDQAGVLGLPLGRAEIETKPASSPGQTSQGNFTNSQNNNSSMLWLFFILLAGYTFYKLN